MCKSAIPLVFFPENESTVRGDVQCVETGTRDTVTRDDSCYGVLRYVTPAGGCRRFGETQAQYLLLMTEVWNERFGY
jgi:ribosomal protein S14